MPAWRRSSSNRSPVERTSRVTFVASLVVVCSRQQNGHGAHRSHPPEAGSGYRVAVGRGRADVLVTGGTVVDGTGAPPVAADVRARDGVIVELTGFSLFGRKKVDVRRSSSMRSAPVVRVQGFTVFGSVLVRS